MGQGNLFAIPSFFRTGNVHKLIARLLEHSMYSKDVDLAGAPEEATDRGNLETSFYILQTFKPLIATARSHGTICEQIAAWPHWLPVLWYTANTSAFGGCRRQHHGRRRGPKGRGENGILQAARALSPSAGKSSSELSRNMAALCALVRTWVILLLISRHRTAHSW